MVVSDHLERRLRAVCFEIYGGKRGGLGMCVDSAVEMFLSKWEALLEIDGKPAQVVETVRAEPVPVRRLETVSDVLKRLGLSQSRGS